MNRGRYCISRNDLAYPTQLRVRLAQASNDSMADAEIPSQRHNSAAFKLDLRERALFCAGLHG